MKKIKNYFFTFLIWLRILKSRTFDRAYYLDNNKDVAASRLPALWHFIRHGAKEGRDPSPSFSVSYYTNMYPDVKGSGLNPLYHYIRFGKAEGRTPTGDVVKKSASSILSSCDSAVLIFDHGSGGGTDKYLFTKLINPTNPLPKTLLVRYEPANKSFCVQVRRKAEVVEEVSFVDWEIFIKEISKFRYSDIIINNLVLFPSVQKVLEWISNYKSKNPAVRVEYKGHDYYCICPSYTLQDNNHKYCGVRCDENECNTCVRTQGSHHIFLDGDNCIKFSVSHWRETWNTFFNNTVDVFEVFSPSSRTVFIKAYPDLSPKIKLTPHKIIPFDCFNIAVIGYLSVQKGSEVVRNFCKFLDDNQIDDMQLYLVGSNPNEIFSSHLTEVGHYERHDLPKKLKEAHIDAVFIPSTWPETFCYTAGESIALGYPTACFDLGGQADQVRASENGIILYDDSPEYLYNTFKTLKKNFAGSKKEELNTEPERSTKTIVLQDRASHDFLKWMYSLRDDKSHFVPEAPDNIVLSDKMPKIFSFYLPQFHDFPENIKWFGRGFTEWSNTSQTVPQYTGHLQPQIPIDVGYYNLQTTNVMYRQAELAKKYGISGFCVYYYWFSGVKLMEKPMEKLLADKALNFPFFFFWANEHWTRLWGDGNDRETLHKSEILPGDAEKFMFDILPYMNDRRYFRIFNKPVLIIYKLHNQPKDVLIKFIRDIRAIAKKSGLNGLYISGTIEEWMDREKLLEYQTEFELDAITEFSSTFGREIHLMEQKFVDPNCRSYCFDMPEFVASKRYLYETKANVFRGLFTSWDNSPRRYSRGASILQNTPEDYKRWLSDLITDTRKHHTPEEQIIFVNAWNEWAECAHLEPDTHYGYAYLQKTREALEESTEN